MPNNEMDYSLIHRTPDGTGKILVTTPGSPDTGSYVLESDMKSYINQGMVAKTDIADNLTTHDSDMVLSAEQGTVLKQLIDAVSGGITPKGDILSTNLPAADDSNKGWQYYCTDLNKYATSDGTQWVYTSNSPIVQIPDATDTGHALSNAVVTQKCNAVEATLDQHDARLKNLEQKAGDYVVVNYRGTNAVPTGKAKYGLVEKIVGKTRAWNNPVFDGTYSYNGIEVTATNGSFTISGTATGSNTVSWPLLDSWQTGFITGHTYLIYGQMTYGSSQVISDAPVFYLNGSNIGTSISNIFTATATSDARIKYSHLSGNVANTTGKFLIRDLTLMFPEGVPSTVAECVEKCPDILNPDPYNAGSLVSTTVEGVESVGVNIWDEDWEQGAINATTGLDTNNTHYLRSKNMIKVKPLTTYFFKAGTAYTYNMLREAFYDSDGNFISAETITLNTATTDEFTTPANAFYMRFQYGDYADIAIITSYNHDIQICLNSYTDKTTYHPYKTDTLSLSTPVTLRSAGSVAEVLTLETGKKTRPIGNVDLGTLNWSFGHGRWVTMFSDYSFVSNNQVCNMTASKYTSASAAEVYEGVSINTIAGEDGTLLSVYNGSDSISPTGILYYELATPLSDEQVCDPIPDNFLEVEGGGTVETIQTQTPVIDNSLDVGYLAV